MKNGTKLRSLASSLGIGALLLMAGARGRGSESKALPALEPPPQWAFAVDSPAASRGIPAQPVDSTPQRVPHSTALFTIVRTKDYFNPPDWHPDHHPAMPDIVAHGRPPEVIACGYCHLPNGQGRPENSSVAGLPAGYILQQLEDFRTGKRQSSEPRHLPTATMVARETKASDEEVAAAARYFSGLKPKRWIRVVETATVPLTKVAGWMFVVTDPARQEPIGQRIIETSEVLERTELRDDASGFIAYVPRGSVKRGERLVRKGGAGSTVQCGQCHGSDLKGRGLVPSIAGRSPSYIVRQLYDIQHGARAGAGAELMTPVVARLTTADMLAIAAYTASLRP
jgi:cytochrome c553